MRFNFWQRGALRASLALGGATTRTIRADGRVMDPIMAALVRLARNAENRMPAGDLPDWRARYAAGPGLTGLRPDRSVRVRPIEAGGLPAREYTPAARARGSMLYFHGGGFILGSLDTHDPLCRRLAAHTSMRLVSVEYRLAPEHPFPAAYEDAAAAWAWARAHLPMPLIVAGDSAGANLAAGIGLTGEPVLQVLLYPVVDMLHEDGRYPSIERFGAGHLLTTEAMSTCADLLIPPGQDRADQRLSPIYGDLSRASPALIVTAGFDPLRDQGTAYADKLRAAGRRVTLVEEPRLVHGFADFAGVVPAARRALDRLAGAIRTELKRE